MAQNDRKPISPLVAQERARMYLVRIGANPGHDMPFTDKPIRLRGKRRNGQHRGHLCSMTSASSKKK